MYVPDFLGWIMNQISTLGLTFHFKSHKCQLTFDVSGGGCPGQAERQQQQTEKRRARHGLPTSNGELTTAEEFNKI